MKGIMPGLTTRGRGARAAPDDRGAAGNIFLKEGKDYGNGDYKRLQ